MCSTPYLPPGFRFHPTDEELIVYYMEKKINSPSSPHVSIIPDIDLYKFNPWELPAKASFGDNEWFLFTPRDRKYPNGERPNRTAGCGYWKATGTDKPILNSGGLQCIGVKKALVFYKGRPTKGIKTDWVMNEYRPLDDNNTVPRIKGSMRLDDWVLCRVRKKNNIPKQNRKTQEDQNSFSNTSQFNTPFSNNTQILKTNNTLASPNENRGYIPDYSIKSGRIDEQINKYYMNMRGFSNPWPNTDTSSYSYDEMSSPLEDVFKALKRTHSMVSFGEEVSLSANKKMHVLPQENTQDMSIFKICYLPDFTPPNIYSDLGP